jgi:hypothetical protein
MSRSIKRSEVIKGRQTTALSQPNIEELTPLYKNTTEIEETDHDDLLRILSDHLAFFRL